MSDQAAQSQSTSPVVSRLSDSSQQLLQQGVGTTPAQPAPKQQSTQASTTENQDVASEVESGDTPQVSDTEKLEIFESVLNEVQPSQSAQSAAQPPRHSQENQNSTSSAVAQSPVQNAPSGGAARAEQLEGSSTSSTTAAELPGGMQYVETEPNPEIPPEVESFLHKAEEHPEQQPTEIVMAEKPKSTFTPPAPKRTVRVLPITKEEADAARKQGVNSSVRWLVEFSEKVTKMFTGAVMYRRDKK